MKLQLLAAPLLVALMLSPAFAAAASGTLTFTSPTAGSSFNNTQGYIIGGTISPVPIAGTDNVNIQVTNPAGTLVDATNVAVSGTGAFSYSTNVGGNPATWTSGTYKISATDSNGAANTATFTYTGSPTPGTSTPIINIFVQAATPVYSGQTVDIEAMLVWSTNGTLVSASATPTTSATLWAPNGVSSSLGAPLASSTRGQVYWTYTVPAASPDGAYFIQVVSKYSGEFGWGLGSFTVNSQIASTSAVTAVQTSLATLTTSVSGIATSLTSVGTAVSSLQGTVGTINTAVAGLTTSVNGLTTTVNAISSSVNGLTTAVGGISTSLGTITSSINTLQGSVTTLSNSVTTLTGDVTTLSQTVSGISTNVNSLSGLSGQMTTLSNTLTGSMTSLQSSVSSLSSSVSNEQTYILVVAAIAVLTLVLELVLLIRKMS